MSRVALRTGIICTQFILIQPIHIEFIMCNADVEDFYFGLIYFAISVVFSATELQLH